MAVSALQFLKTCMHHTNNKKRSHTQLDSRKQVIAFQDRVFAGEGLSFELSRVVLQVPLIIFQDDENYPRVRQTA